MKRLLDPNEEIKTGDEIWNANMGRWDAVWGNLEKACNGAVIRREVPDPKWRKIDTEGAKPPCYLSDGEFVSCDTGPITWGNLRGRATYWMPFDLPGLPVPEIPDDEIAFQKWFKTNMIEGEWIARPAWKAALEHAKQVRLEFGMKYMDDSDSKK